MAFIFHTEGALVLGVRIVQVNVLDLPFAGIQTFCGEQTESCARLRLFWPTVSEPGLWGKLLSWWGGPACLGWGVLGGPVGVVWCGGA